MEYVKTISKWEMWEVALEGPIEGNPFMEQHIRGTFCGKYEKVTSDGFYDGEGKYRIRFMPSFTGKYSFILKCSFLEEEMTGDFWVKEAKLGNHGPVRVANVFHFAYEDKKPFYPVGTTCYVWHLQTDNLIQETLKQLKEAGFNKLRFCILPKHMYYNTREPRSYPYVGKPMDSSVLTDENIREYTGAIEGNKWDFTRFQPEYFKHIEKCLEALQELEMEADLIVMHPYDRWGFSSMTRKQDELYWNYIIARFSAYRNVWWALANEYDFMKAKTTEDWERYAELLCKKDPYNHLRSIHNAGSFYDHSRPWITHCSIQKQEIYKTAEYTDEWRKHYNKPVVLDEISYEGNLPYSWGNITGEEMVRRFWEAVCRGGYAGHGETFENPEEVLWWSHGGRLRGESWTRIKFLHKILSETPGYGLVPLSGGGECATAVSEMDKACGTLNYIIHYYSFLQPAWQKYDMDGNTKYQIEVIDTWNMTITDMGTYCGKFKIILPGKKYIAVRMKNVELDFGRGDD